MKSIILKMIISLLIILPLTIIIHETGHWLVGNFMYHADVQVTFPLTAGSLVQMTGYTIATTGPLCGYAGGLFAALILFIFYLGLKQKLWYEFKIILLILAAANVTYGIYEGFMFSGYYLFGIWMLGLALLTLVLCNVIQYYDKQPDTREAI